MAASALYWFLVLAIPFAFPFWASTAEVEKSEQSIASDTSGGNGIRRGGAQRRGSLQAGSKQFCNHLRSCLCRRVSPVLRRRWRAWYTLILAVLLLGLLVRTAQMAKVASARSQLALNQTLFSIYDACGSCDAANDTNTGRGCDRSSFSFTECNDHWVRSAPSVIYAGGVQWTTHASTASTHPLVRALHREFAKSHGTIMALVSSFFVVVAISLMTAAGLDFVYTSFLLLLSSLITPLLLVYVWSVDVHALVFALMALGGCLMVFVSYRHDVIAREDFVKLRRSKRRAYGYRRRTQKLEQELKSLVPFDAPKATEKKLREQEIDHAFSSEELNQMSPVDFEDLTLKREIGRGAHGEVILATLLDTPVVLKRVERSKISQERVRAFVAEIKLMLPLRHPNIVMLIGATYNTSCNIGMLVEWCERGDLHAVLEKDRCGSMNSFSVSGRSASERRESTRTDDSVEDRSDDEDGTRLKIRGTMTWSDPLLKIAIDAARGLAYLHSKGVMHRDVKSPNLLVTSTYSCKVSDFGLSRRADLLSSVVGSSLWVAPEILKMEKYTSMSDAFSYGIVLTEMVTRELPYQDQRPMSSVAALQQRIAVDGLRPNMPQPGDTSYPNTLHQVVQSCLATDPTARPTFVEILHSLQGAVRDELDGKAWDSCARPRPALVRSTRQEARESFLRLSGSREDAAPKPAGLRVVNAVKTGEASAKAGAVTLGALEPVLNSIPCGNDDDGGGIN